MLDVVPPTLTSPARLSTVYVRQMRLWNYLLILVQVIPKKNVETDIVGDKIGRIFLGKQDLSEL